MHCGVLEAATRVWSLGLATFARLQIALSPYGFNILHGLGAEVDA